MPRQFLILGCCLLLVQIVTALTGDNVCNHTEVSTETIEYIVTEPVTYRIYTWCLKMPPRCSKYTTIMKERIKRKLQINNNTVDFCCDGFVQLETYCVPECNRTECPNMKCDNEKKCICEAGYYGQRCHRICRPGFWGENCASKCACNGEPCNLISGDCLPQTTSNPLVTSFNNDSTSPIRIPLPNDNILVTQSFKNIVQTPQQTTSTSIVTKKHTKSTKTDLSDDIDESEIDPTKIPIGFPFQEGDTTLLPEDEVIIVYPSEQTKSYSPVKKSQTTKMLNVNSAPTSVRTTTVKVLQIDHFTKPFTNLDKIKKPTTSDYYSKIYELKHNKKIVDNSFAATTEQTKDNINKKHTNKYSMNINKKYDNSTTQPITKNILYNVDYSMPKKSNGLPPPVPDGSNNSLLATNYNFKNVTPVVENYNNRSSSISNSNNIIKTNEIQRDMEELNNNNFSTSNSDTSVNSSLVKARWKSALGVIDFTSPTMILSVTITVILFLTVIAVMITHCKKKRNEQTSYYDNNVKASHHNDSTAMCNGYYTSPGGHPVFFCPAFTNTYAFELAQELREAHYDHPRSARCLTNEPVYAELQY